MMYVQTAENGGRDSRDSVQYDYDAVINKRLFSAAVANLFAKTGPFRFNALASAVKTRKAPPAATDEAPPISRWRA